MRCVWRSSASYLTTNRFCNSPSVLTNRPLFALCLLASASAQEPSVVDRYLTAIARTDWTARVARIAAIRTPAEVEQRQAFVRSKIIELLGEFPVLTPLNPCITGSFI